MKTFKQFLIEKLTERPDDNHFDVTEQQAKTAINAAFVGLPFGLKVTDVTIKTNHRGVKELCVTIANDVDEPGQPGYKSAYMYYIDNGKRRSPSNRPVSEMIPMWGKSLKYALKDVTDETWQYFNSEEAQDIGPIFVLTEFGSIHDLGWQQFKGDQSDGDRLVDATLDEIASMRY